MKTPLYRYHVARGAKIVDFHGWEMPVEYSGVLKETIAVRTSCGLFDLSHMGELEITGKNRLKFLQRITTNNIAALPEYAIQYNVACNEQGGILDDFMVYHCGDSYMCVVNASNAEKMYAWFTQHAIDGAVITNKSAATALIALQGPASERILKTMVDSDLANLGYMTFRKGTVNGAAAIISRSGYTGEDGFEIYCANADAPAIWERLCKEGASFGIVPCGLGARDILRLEMGYTLYGNEIDETLNPIEAGLRWVVKCDHKDFIGKKVVCAEASRGSKQLLVGFVMQERGIPRHGYTIYSLNNEKIGFVTSGNFSPNKNAFVGRGYVKTTFAREGNEIAIAIRDKTFKARITRPPFVTPQVKKSA